ncbi:MAG: ParB/RepB/Spo0J family partition protein [Clostridia bacterium]|nr:ParB/RepB/Spo0J family partition protein [Clostridia bacterium]
MKTEEIEEKTALPSKIWSLETAKIVPNPSQPRKIFVEEQILRLADSIRQFGIIQPLTVRRVDECYELISGERRLRAAQELGMKYVPCIISNATEVESAEISIIENLMREDLNIFEQALAIQALMDTHGLTQEQIATKLSNSQSFVANKLRLLRLTQEEREKILEHKLSERHARALLRVFDPETRARLLKQIIDEGLNVAKTEEIVDKLVAKPAKEEKQAIYKDIGAFMTAINRAIETASRGGFKVKSRKIENDNFTELTILIPKAQESAILESSLEFQLVTSKKTS